MCKIIRQNGNIIVPGDRANFLLRTGKIANGFFGVMPDKGGPRMVNARVELLSSTWSNWMDNKGILLINGFYEGERLFHLSDDREMAVPIIYNENFDFIIVTRTAKPPVLPIIDRQPMVTLDTDRWFHKTTFLPPEEDFIVSIPVK